MKTLACVETGVIIKADLMEGAERNAQKDYADQGAGTGTSLRLTQAYHRTGRVLVGDSWFASVLTCVALFQAGLFFIGIVKTASRFFPKEFLSDWLEANHARENRGKHILLKTKRDGVDVYALGWSDKKGKQIIFTSGTTNPGAPSVRVRHKAVVRDGVWVKTTYQKVVNRPHVTEEMFNAYSTIDVHDHYRQGSLEIERLWITKDWILRIFGPFLGIIIVNSFNCYRFFIPESVDFNIFLGRLSYQLIFNKFLEIEENERVLRQRPGMNPEVSDSHTPAKFIDLDQYSDLRNTSKRATRQCANRSCKKKTVWYCVKCSNVEENIFKSFCLTKRDCFINHIK